MPKALASDRDFARLLDDYDCFLFDCDGVIWNGSTGNDLTPNVGQAIELLRLHGKQLAFVTNNATQSRTQYAAKFKRLGIHGVEKDDIFTSGSASAQYVKEHVLPHMPDDRKGLYVVGQAGLEEELRDFGLQWTGGSAPEDDMLPPYQDFSSIRPDPSIGTVLFSFQMHINYLMYARAYNYLATNKAQLVLTNDDSTVLIPDGVCPGEGALASVLYGALGDRKPITVGKPYQPLLDIVHETLEYDPSRTLFVGDRLETDVLFGKRGKLGTLLVWTGASKPADLDKVDAKDLPDYTANCVGDVVRGFSSRLPN